MESEVLKYLVTIFTPSFEVFTVTSTNMCLNHANFRTLIVTVITFEFLKCMRFQVIFNISHEPWQFLHDKSLEFSFSDHFIISLTTGAGEKYLLNLYIKWSDQ